MSQISEFEMESELKRAEIRKLEAETLAINRPLSQPSNWVPIAIAMASALAAIGQWQFNRVAAEKRTLEEKIKLAEVQGKLSDANGELKTITNNLRVSVVKLRESKNEIAGTTAELLAVKSEMLSDKEEVKELKSKAYDQRRSLQELRFHSNALRGENSHLRRLVEADAFFKYAADHSDAKTRIEMYSKTIEINKSHVFAMSNRCSEYSRLGEFEKALKDCHAAISIIIKDGMKIYDNKVYMSKYFYNRGSVYFNLNRDDEAFEDLNKSVSLDPSFTSALRSRARLYVRQNRVALAVQDYEKIVEIDSNDHAARNGLAWLLIDSKIDVTRGVEIITEVVKKYSNVPSYLDTLGWGHFRSGNLELARKWIGKAKELAPEDKDILEHLELVERRLSKQ